FRSRTGPDRTRRSAASLRPGTRRSRTIDRHAGGWGSASSWCRRRTLHRRTAGRGPLRVRTSPAPCANPPESDEGTIGQVCDGDEYERRCCNEGERDEREFEQLSHVAQG